MKFIKFIGLICLICFTFIYTEKIISIGEEQDEIMIKLKEIKDNYRKNPQEAIINNDEIIPGNIGKYLDIDSSYKKMKKIGYFEESLLTFKNIYPDISIYNNYNKYIINGNNTKKQISLIYIIKNDKTIDNVLNIVKNKESKITFFIDSNFLNNNIDIINKLNNYEIYNYGDNEKYTKNNLIITNNIINNKSNNQSTFCLFTTKNNESLNNCANSKMLSILIPKETTYNNIKQNIQNGNIINIKNTKELSSIIDYIKTKGFDIVSLKDNVNEE